MRINTCIERVNTQNSTFVAQKNLLIYRKKSPILVNTIFIVASGIRKRKTRVDLVLCSVRIYPFLVAIKKPLLTETLRIRNTTIYGTIFRIAATCQRSCVEVSTTVHARFAGDSIHFAIRLSEQRQPIRMTGVIALRLVALCVINGERTITFDRISPVTNCGTTNTIVDLA